MAVKKKSAAKKAAPKKSAAKKTAAKKVVKKSAAKKTVAKKTAKKTVVKKSAAKKVAKKSTVKKSAAKKSTTKKSAVKKSAARKKASSAVVIPPVPAIGGARVNVSTTPAPNTPRTSAPAAKPAPAAKSAPAKSNSSSKVLFAVLLGILLVGAIVVSNSGKDSDDAAMPAPVATESAAPEAEATQEAEATEETPAPTPISGDTTGEAPSRFIGNWKDSSKSVMVITWKAPAGDVKGYAVETRANLGEWKVVSELSATTFGAEFAKSSTDGSTSFRVSAIYQDGSRGVATPFGFAGQFE